MSKYYIKVTLDFLTDVVRLFPDLSIIDILTEGNIRTVPFSERKIITSHGLPGGCRLTKQSEDMFGVQILKFELDDGLDTVRSDFRIQFDVMKNELERL